MDKQFKKITQYDAENGLDNTLKKLTPKVAEKVVEMFTDIQYDFISSLVDCESPIEQMLSIALWDVLQSKSVVHKQFSNQFDVLEVQTQRDIIIENKTYRVDFFIPVWSLKTRKDYGFIIECDGHDFHEKTKEQAQKDKARDRVFLKNNYTVIRFTGSEIYKNSYSCANQILDIIISKIKDGD